MSYKMNGIHQLITICLLASSQAFLRRELLRSSTDQTHIFCPDVKPLIRTNMVAKFSRNPLMFFPGDEVWISCQPGHVIRGGSDQLYCQDDGSWDGEIGRCEAATCRTPNIPKNGNIPQMMRIKGNTIPEGFEITYTCSSGFRLIGSSWNRCVKGRWNFEEPQCEAIRCSDPGTPEKGMRKGNNFDIGSKVSFSCYSGYTLLGSLERYCLPNGQWSGELTRCNSPSNYCPDPGVPINGIKTGSVYKKYSSVEYQCYPGFTLIGSETRECQQDRSWSGVEPKCQGSYDFDNSPEVARRLKAAMKAISEFSQNVPQLPEIPVTEDEAGADDKKKEPSGGIFGFNILSIFTGFTHFDTNSWVPEIPAPTAEPIPVNPPRVITYFIFDASGSIGDDNFRMCIEFAKSLVKKMEISVNGNRVGALSFSSHTVVHFIPAGIESTEEALNALDEVVYMSGGTAINKAFEVLVKQIIPSTRKTLGVNTRSVAYLFTDGKANMGGPPKIWAEKLKETGMEINCIGIAGAQKNDLQEIASEPSKEHVFTLSSYSQMRQLIGLITSDAEDYSRCGFGLEDVVIRHDQKGGSESIRNASEPWPWMAALYISRSIREVPRKVKCGGSIVGNKWILTAAHCLKDQEDKNQILDRRRVIVKLGITEITDESTAKEYSPEMFFIHPRYDPHTLDHDIALIKLENLIEYNSHIRPVCLPPQVLPENTSLYKHQEYAFVTGWGSIEKRKPTLRAMSRMRNVQHLKEIVLPIQSRDRCELSLIDTTYNFTRSMFCAGSQSSDVDACTGDSGSPMVQHQLDNEGNIYWVQVGIVSWGIGCRQRGTYGFYSHVQRARKWITDTMNSN